jgi:hypothetical protein
MARTITGMMKIFKQNFLAAEALTFSVTSGAASIDNIKDFDKNTKWVSVGSDDLTTEVITITFTNSVTINRLLLLNMNFKNFSAEYWNGSIWTDFTNVYSDATSSVKSEISETANTENSKYYEFDEVTTTKVRVSATETFIANAEKFLHEMYVGSEIGTFIDDITSSPNKYKPIVSNTRSTYITKSNGGMIKYERGDKYNVKVDIKELFNTEDQDIVNTMYDDGQFAIYPCGAIPYSQRGWRAQDLYNVIIRGNNQAEFAVGRVAAIGTNYSFEWWEQ